MAAVLLFLRADEVKTLNSSVEKEASVVHIEVMLGSAINSLLNHQHYETENDQARLAALLSCALIKKNPSLNGKSRCRDLELQVKSIKWPLRRA